MEKINQLPLDQFSNEETPFKMKVKNLNCNFQSFLFLIFFPMTFNNFHRQDDNFILALICTESEIRRFVCTVLAQTLIKGEHCSLNWIFVGINCQLVEDFN